MLVLPIISSGPQPVTNGLMKHDVLVEVGHQPHALAPKLHHQIRHGDDV